MHAKKNGRNTAAKDQQKERAKDQHQTKKKRPKIGRQISKKNGRNKRPFKAVIR